MLIQVYFIMSNFTYQPLMLLMLLELGIKPVIYKKKAKETVVKRWLKLTHSIIYYQIQSLLENKITWQLA